MRGMYVRVCDILLQLEILFIIVCYFPIFSDLLPSRLVVPHKAVQLIQAHTARGDLRVRVRVRVRDLQGPVSFHKLLIEVWARRRVVHRFWSGCLPGSARIRGRSGGYKRQRQEAEARQRQRHKHSLNGSSTWTWTYGDYQVVWVW